MVKVLLAEDSRDVAVMIAEMLTREGCDVDVVGDGRKVIEKIEAHPDVYDVLVTDLLMPEIDGFGVLRHLKSNSIDIPVIVLSGGGVTLKSEDALRAVSGLASAVMKKPVNCAALLEKIKEVAVD